jgi:hypothetical protein
VRGGTNVTYIVLASCDVLVAIYDVCVCQEGKPPMSLILSDVSHKFKLIVKLPREIKTLLAVAFWYESASFLLVR